MSRGFSLIEILVVIVIIGVLALAVTLGVASASTERQLTRESERVQALIEHACMQSELTGREIGLRIDDAGYAFFQLGFSGWTDGALGNELRPRTWVQGMLVRLRRDGREVRLAQSAAEPPQIVCFSSGELSPFELQLALGDAAVNYEVRGDASGKVSLHREQRRP
ncbi:MAG: type II secretion system protein GspH [Gammaproteobacteria bacterium]|nr:MAG: type II secretion system protein GspH [Gammaproteobacteria bacterium]